MCSVKVDKLFTREDTKKYLGKVFGNLTVTSVDEVLSGKSSVVCSCLCGTKDLVVLLGSLKSGNSKSCGCGGGINITKTYLTKTGAYPYKVLRCEKVKTKRGLERRFIVQFLNTGYTKSFKISNVKVGNIVDPYQPKIYGVGFIGDGVYNSKTRIRGVLLYNIWAGMFHRCYNEDIHCTERYKGLGVVVNPSWYNFQEFSRWYVTEISKLPDTVEYQMDKDLKGGKEYSERNCLLLPKKLNIALQTKRRYTNTTLSVGVRVQSGKFLAQVNDYRRKGQKICGNARENLEDAIEDYYSIKKSELVSQTKEMYENGLIPIETKILLENVCIKTLISNKEK